MVVSSACMMVAVMAQIVTMLRRKPGTMLDGGAVAVIATSVLVVIRIRRCRREAEQASQRAAMVGVDRRVDAHAGFELADESVVLVEINPHRHALHHFYEIA